MQDGYDSIIIGHGLAGAILAHTLIRRGQRVMVLDQEGESSASKVAAGIINPVTGHRLNITEGFEKLMPIALHTYTQLAKDFGEILYSPTEQIRFLKNKGQFEYFNQRRTQSEYQDILGAYIEKPREFNNSGFGATTILQSGIVNSKKLLALSQRHLQGTGSYRALKVDHQYLAIQDAGVNYDGIRARRVIFCEGHRATKNPWLPNLPFKLAKGEIANLQLNTDLSRFLNWGNWLIPDPQNNSYRLGSTYEWKDLSLRSTKSATLLESLRSFTGLHGRLVSTDVGIRPTTVHRTPFVGALSTMKNSFCFNGFGSKGCLLIPSYAHQLADNIIHAKPLDRELCKWL